MAEPAADAYAELGVPFDAPHNDCKDAFHALSKALHSDKVNRNNALSEQEKARMLARFQNVTAAWNNLKNEAVRVPYNRQLERDRRHARNQAAQHAAEHAAQPAAQHAKEQYTDPLQKEFERKAKEAKERKEKTKEEEEARKEKAKEQAKAETKARKDKEKAEAKARKDKEKEEEKKRKEKAKEEEKEEEKERIAKAKEEEKKRTEKTQEKAKEAQNKRQRPNPPSAGEQPRTDPGKAPEQPPPPPNPNATTQSTPADHAGAQGTSDLQPFFPCQDPPYSITRGDETDYTSIRYESQDGWKIAVKVVKLFGLVTQPTAVVTTEKPNLTLTFKLKRASDEKKYKYRLDKPEVILEALNTPGSRRPVISSRFIDNRQGDITLDLQVRGSSSGKLRENTSYYINVDFGFKGPFGVPKTASTAGSQVMYFPSYPKSSFPPNSNAAPTNPPYPPTSPAAHLVRNNRGFTMLPMKPEEYCRYMELNGDKCWKLIAVGWK